MFWQVTGKWLRYILKNKNCIHVYIVHIKISIYIQYIISYHIISYHIISHTSSVSKKKILEPDVLQTNANHLVGIPGASHLSPNSDVYLRRNCTSQSWIKPFVVLGIFSAKARDPFIIHPCFFMFVQYDFNDPLRGPWRFASIHGCFNTIWIDWYFAFYHPVLFPCIPKAGPWVLQWDRRYGWPPTTNCCSLVPKRGGIDVSTHISYIYICIYIYIDCYVCKYIYI